MPEDDRSPDEIERDLRATRANLDETLDAIQRKLTPGELFDEALGYLRQSGGAGEVARVIRDNPLPVLVIGVGLLWLVVAGSRRPQPGVARSDYVLDRTGADPDLQSEYPDPLAASEAVDAMSRPRGEQPPTPAGAGIRPF